MILQSSTANLLRGNICGLGPIQESWKQVSAFQAGFSVGPVLISCFLFIQAFFIYWSCLIPFPLCLLFCHQQPLLLLLPLAVAVCLAVVDRNILRKGDVTESNVLAVSRRLRRPLINANPLRFWQSECRFSTRLAIVDVSGVPVRLVFYAVLCFCCVESCLRLFSSPLTTCQNNIFSPAPKRDRPLTNRYLVLHPFSGF